MFNNHTKENVFEVFESKYKNALYHHYPHLSEFDIHCYTFDQYSKLSNVPKLVNYREDTFAYAICHPKGSKFCDTFAAIVFSPSQCNSLAFNIQEYFAAIAHEIGHIIHFFNENLNGANELIVEMKADSIAKELGLSDHLKSVLRKLKESGMYNDAQRGIMTMRANLLE